MKSIYNSKMIVLLRENLHILSGVLYPKNNIQQKMVDSNHFFVAENVKKELIVRK